MAIAAFIPQIWSARFTSKLRDMLVWGSVMNANYEGEITAAGDTVKIPSSTTSITVSDYTENTDINDAELADGTTQDLVINKKKYFHFYVDDITEAQTRPEVMDDAMREAAFQMANEQDNDYRATVISGFDASRNVNVDVASGGSVGDDAHVTAVLKAFTSRARAMDEANIPQEGRWSIVSPLLKEMLNNWFAISGGSDSVYVPATSEQTLRNGFIGRLLGFDLRVTNKRDTSSTGSGQTRKNYDRYWFGQGTEANTRAEQLVSIEAYRPEKRFGDAVKGLRVYGSKQIHAARLWTASVQNA